MSQDKLNREYEPKLTNSWEQHNWDKEEELGTFQAPYDSFIITPEQLEKLKEQGIDIILIVSNLK